MMCTKVKGANQSEALMPTLFALGQHQALVAVHDHLAPQERLFAFHDNTHAVSSPERVSNIHNMLHRELWIHSRIQVHQGKTQLWNRASHVGSLSASHQRLVDRIPHITDLQSAWLLLLFCAASRPNYILRVVHPQTTRAFAARHDVSMRRCMEILLDVSITDHTWDIGSLPLHMGGLGKQGWSSWADGLSMIRRQHGLVAELIVRELSVEHPVFHLASVVARDRLTEMGFVAPSWEALANGERPDVNSLDDVAPSIPKHGWQHKTAQKADDFFMSTSVWPRLHESSRALLRSQGGPLSGLPFTCCPTSFHNRFEAQLFRVLLLFRRLWLPLPPTSRSCRCGRPLDALGHHRTACPTVGVLGRRGSALESAAARVCREAGGCVSVNVAVRDLDIGVPDEADARRLEVVVDGLPLFHGAQLGVDTTLVSVLRRDGTPHPRCANADGAALATARRRKEARFPELAGQHGRARLVVLASEVGGRWSEECRQFLCLLAKAKVRNEPKIMRSRTEQVWLLRWGSILACSSSRAFAMSLLERRGGMGADGLTPSTDDVVWEARFSAP